MRIEMMIIIRITLKLVLLAIVRRMLILSTTNHIMMLLTIFLSIKERIKYLYKILMWELVLLNLKGKCNLIISLTKRIFLFQRVLMIDVVMCMMSNGKATSLNEGCLGFNHKVMIRGSLHLVIIVTRKSMVYESLSKGTSFVRGICIILSVSYLR